MRKIIFTFFLLFTFFNLFAQEPPKIKNLGLISELAYAKYSAENHLLITMTKLNAFVTDSNGLVPVKITNEEGNESRIEYVKISQEKRDSIYNKHKLDLIKKYLETKTVFDQLILQLEGDLYSKNSSRLYKKINKELIDKEQIDNVADVKNAKVKRYLSALHFAYSYHYKLIHNFERTGGIEFIELAALEIPAAMEQVYGIIKDMRDAREKKVTNINTLLGSLRLSSVKDVLSGQVEKSEEEK